MKELQSSTILKITDVKKRVFGTGGWIYVFLFKACPWTYMGILEPN